jgi:cobalt/nickel transport protein
MKKRALIILGIFLALVPLGLLTDAPAWGEWDNEYYEKVLGFLPQGFKEAIGINPIIPDYSLPHANPVLGYYVSAVVGAVLVFGIYYILAKIIKSNKN